MNEITEFLPLMLPLILIQLALMTVALVNLAKRKKVRFDNKFIWAIIIICGGLLGPIIYFIARGDDE